MQLWHASEGDGDPALVLLHLGIADSRMWDRAWPLLARMGLRLVRIDLPGFGRSPAGGMHAPAREVLATLDRIGVARAHVVGPSYGGAVAIDLALRAPDRVASLVLVGPAVPGLRSGDELREYLAEEARLLARGDLAAATELNLRTWLDGARAAHEVDAALRADAAVWCADALRRLPDQGDPRWVEPLPAMRLAEIRAPTLLLAGGADQPSVIDKARILSRHIPRARFREVAGVAHYLGAELPERFAAEVEAFVTGGTGAASRSR